MKPSIGRATVAIVVLFIGGVWLGLADKVRLPRLEWPSPENDGYHPARRLAEGRELLLVAIVSANCVWSNLPEVTSAVRGGKVAAQTTG